MSITAERYDLAALEKIRFVAIVLPTLGTLGGLLRASGQSEATMLMFVVPLLFVSFFGWRFARTSSICPIWTGVVISSFGKITA